MKVKTLLLLIVISVTIFSQQENLPLWAKGVVWYQIFPERFANGDTSNDPEAEKVFINSKKTPQDWTVTKWTSNWFAQSDWEREMGGKNSHHYYERRYGGDIQGIIDRLDYLKDLGVGAIYLNPVFEAVSLHKYDGSSYHHIDVNFGPNPTGDRKIMSSEIPDNPGTWKWTSADKLFLKLIDEVHNRGMKIIIDGVFNHTGVQFLAFQDIVKYQEQSRYKDWYLIESFDDPKTSENEFDYKGWWGTKSLPEFSRTKDDLADGPKKYIFHSTQKWMDPNGDGDPSDGIDGWRLDVAREVPIGFWTQWREVVKKINSQALIVGELWELSPDFISDDGAFDALMNYNFAFAVNDFFIADKNKISFDEFVKRLQKIDKTYPYQNLFVLQNLLSSHDTERLSSMIKNPDRKYEHDANENNPNYNPGKPTSDDIEKQKLIAAFQLLYRGAPMIYYGDEVGMWGADDPHDRKPMVWKDLVYDNEVIDENSGFKTGLGSYSVEQNESLLKFYKDIIEIRNNNEELKTGTIKFIYFDNDKNTFAFESVIDNKKIICAFNLGEAEVILPLDYNVLEIYPNNRETSIKTISSNSFKVYRAIN
ncbi:MAG: glycoside hydrolase family 13 protein [Ignavibacterium sp.]|nr:glycoside hydrolase family 13 protein [Ignavibacterium sp.]